MFRASCLVIGLATTLAITGCHSGNNFNSGQETQASTTINATTAASDDFLAKNKTAPGVVTTASGLQYKVNKEGTGPKPNSSDVVTVQYEGRLTNGSVFDSTDMHGGQPISFPLNGVIAGWTEGLQLMHEGSDYTLYIPANLAYGADSPTSAIPPNSTLIFDIKLIKVGR